MNILIVEDDAASRLLLERVVSSRNHTVTGCPSAEDAMMACANGFFSMIILDLMLPGVDGLGFCRWARKQPWGNRTFILVATGRKNADLAAVLEAGANDYVAKPFDLAAVQIRLAVAERQVEEISERHIAEKALLTNERRFTAFMNHIPGVAWMKNANGQYIYCNEKFDSLFSGTPANWRGKTDVDLWPPEMASKFKTEDDLVLSSRQPLQIMDRWRCNGENHFWLVSKFPVFDGDDEVRMIAALAVDVTQQRQLEEMNRMILQTAMDGFWLVDQQGKILEVNDAYCRLTGYSREELLKMSIVDIRADQSAEAVRQHLANILASKKARFESQHRCKDGHLVEFEVSVNQVEIGGEQRLTSFFRDITERKKLAEERLKTSKLESIGLLAGSIAHEFNNSLTSIMGNVALTLNELPPDHVAAEWLESAQHSAGKATHLARQLLTFAKGGEPAKKLASLRDLLAQKGEELLRDQHCQVNWNLADDLWCCYLDPSQIGQVIQNLVRNALEAGPSSQTLNISARNVFVQANKMVKLKAGRYVQFSIQDTASGIAPDVLPKIFDPYFTTRKGHQGLGLAISYSIINKHGGAITVDSRPDEGSTFTVFLPATLDTLQSGTQSPSPAPTSGRVLVMDDEPGIRDLLARILSNAGYSVALSRDGREALAAYEEARSSQCPFDIVILDLTIPEGMGGKDTMEQLLKIDPQCKVIVCSGYSDDPVMANFHRYGFRASLPKPFTGEDLLRVLKETLQGSGTSAVPRL